MATKRKLLVIQRHGVKRGDDIIPESIQRLYDNVGGDLAQSFILPYGVTQTNIMLWHSNKPRTKYTGRAIIAGALSLHPRPEKQEDLDDLFARLPSLDSLEVPMLGYDDLTINSEAEDRLSEKEYMDLWVSDPDSNVLEGKPNTAFNKVIQTRGDYLRGLVKSLVRSIKDLALLTTHCGISEPLMLSLMNSARQTPAKLEDIGGIFQMEQYAQLILDQSAGDRYTATLKRNESSYPVDLQRFLNP